MPYCEPCDKWRAPNALMPDGTCPKCGSQVESETETSERQTAIVDGKEQHKIPWHFWLMIAAVTIYLGWRVVEGAIWLFS